MHIKKKNYVKLRRQQNRYNLLKDYDMNKQ